MIALLLLIIFCYHIQSVTAQTIMIIRSPVNQSACVGGTVNFTCVVMFTSGPPSAASWFTNNGINDATALSGHTRTDDSNGRSAPANVTTVLTVTNVSISDNGADYICAQGRVDESDTVFLTVFGIPDDITDLSIPPDTISACSIVVQWSRPSNDPVCGTVWYTVTISSEGGVMIITDNTTMTSYDVTGLNDNTVYHVSVTASNNAGSSSSVTMVTMTNSNGLPSPPVTAVTPLSNTSFTINWSPSDTDFNYTVMWTNLNTAVVDSFTVLENTNSYTVTGLSDTDNYNVSVVIVGLCGMMTSDLITVYGNPPTPEFDYCISYSDGQLVLQLISYVTVTTPRTSLSLTFSASHQTGNSSSQSAMCSSLSDMQYNCTAEFTVDINPSVDTIESVTVTVSGPYGSTSSLKSISQGVNPISSIEETDITENSATLTCKLPCFSPNVQCVLSQFISCTNVNVTIGNITGSVESYSYPTQTISVSGLNSNTTYKYCVALTNTTNMIMVGGPVCGSFTTQKIISEANDDSSLSTEVTVAITFVITFILTLIIATVITAIITYICVKRKFEKIIQDFKDMYKEQNKTVFYEQVGPSNQTITKNDFELQANPAYGISHNVIMDTNPAYESCK